MAINKEEMARYGMVTDVSHITEQRSIILYFHMPYLVGRWVVGGYIGRWMGEWVGRYVDL